VGAAPYDCIGRAAWLSALVVLASACGREERPVREWRASDHAEPGPVEPGGQAPPEGDAPGAAGGGTSADPGESPEARDARAVAELYGVICASCHGPRGDGDGPARAPGMAMPRFSDPAWQASRTDEAIAQVIVEGRGAMPAFGQQVNPRGVAALVRYLRALGSNAAATPDGAQRGGTVDTPPTGPATPGTDG